MICRLLKPLSLLLALGLLLGALAGCVPAENDPTTQEIPKETIDYAAKVKLEMQSPTLKQEVTVKTYVDGDTVHFNVPADVIPGGVLKARFLAINTPESTGKVEEYGKTASIYTKTALQNAVSIILESDSDTWNLDSTGNRYLVWVWYKTADMTDYRNLNIELLQNGLAAGSNAGGNIYGSYAQAALAQAMEQKLNMYSGEKDPNFYYGDIVELDLRELRQNMQSYEGMKVAFTGVVTVDYNNGVYVEAYDEESGLYNGIYVFYNYNLNGDGINILQVGNEVRIVGTVQYYETGDSWQVSGVSYRSMKPNDPNNLQKLGEGKQAAYTLTDPATFANGQVDMIVNDEVVTRPYAELVLGTTVQMDGLTVKSSYTTTAEDSSSKGAFTLTCEANGVTVDVRTVVLHDSAGDLITADAYEGKTISVRGIVDYFDGAYQIKVFSAKDITIQ